VINAGPEGEIEIDLGLRQVRRRGHVVNLTATEFRLLDALAAMPGRAFTRAELAQRAFGHGYEALEAHHRRPRHESSPQDRARALASSAVIVTVFGTGYRLEVRAAD
jgi:DNA-binding response OmpR family regulator